MAEVVERLALLEREVQRAIELIGSLRQENRRLAEEREALTARAHALEAEMETLRQRGEALARLETAHGRLVEERQHLLGQVEGMLKELARIEGV